MLDRDVARGSSSSASSTATARGASTAMAIPMIPGLVSTQRHFIGRTNFHKGQVLERMAQGRLETVPPAVAPPPPPSAPAKTNKTQSATPPRPPPASSAYRTDVSQPAWLRHDRQVLRFFGYVLERIVTETHAAPPTEHDRVRRVVVLYYLSDGSLAVSEPRVANSGAAQGQFLQRTRGATKPDGEAFTPHDFSVGGRVRLYGRTLHLVDCDAATRAYYADALGSPQGDPRPYPDDAPRSHIDEIAALKQRLLEKRAASTESAAARARQFHANAQRVLRFFVSWHDPHPLYPETRRYTLHYYLCDDSLELVEPKREREGRGHFAVLLSRRRVPRITDRELRCGEMVEIASRRFLLEDCDAFTRDYYLETHGVTQEKHDPEAARPHDAAAKWKLFQVDAGELLATMQGREPYHLDRASGRRLHLQHATHGDATDDNKQLRFRARQQPGARAFVVTFYLEDATLSVFEPPDKTVRVTGGRFLDRGKFRLAATGQFVTASDLFVGATLAFAFAPQQSLELLEADRQTLAYCEAHADQFPFSDAKAVLAAIAACSVSPAALRRACRGLDVARDDTLHVADVRRVLETVGVARALNAQQLVTLCRAFEDNGDRADSGSDGDQARGPPPFLYDDFCDALAMVSSTATTSGDVLDKLRKCRGLRRLLREADAKRQRAVDTSELQRVAAAFKLQVSHSEALALATRFPGSHRQRRDVVVDYNALCDRVFDGAPEARAKTSEPTVRTREAANNKAARGRIEHDATDDNDDHDWEEPANQHSFSRRANRLDDDSDDEFGDFGQDSVDGDACLPDGEEAIESPRRHATPGVPLLPRPLPVGTARGSALAAPRKQPASSSLSSDARVVALLRRAFGDRKYLLRKALRDRDRDKTGLLGEEAFMAAVLAVEPQLSDDDTYLLADAYFPTNNSQIDYAKLLESTFRT